LSGVRAAAVALAAGVAACSGATNVDLLTPAEDYVGPSSSGGAGSSGSSSGSSMHPAGGSSGGASPDAADTGMSSDDDASGGNENEAGPQESGPPPGAEPASPCNVTCLLGTQCCTLAGSQTYGQCYNPNFCFTPNCCTP
jgi:hypothetical protein